jgi:energy-coupling factor transport system ATP-binding protein
MKIEISNLKYKYRNDLPLAIDGVNLNIRPGEKILIAGKNGAGKTTLSKILSGLIPHAEKRGVLEGSCRYDAKESAEMAYKEIAGRVAILFQDFESQIVSTTVKEELIFFPLNLGRSYRESLKTAKELASKFKMEQLFDRNITEMSGGERQKTAMLSLLTASPEVLILDEPMTDIDPRSQEEILDFLSAYNGTLVVFEQSVDYYRYFDRIIIMKEGRILSDTDISSAGNPELLAEAGLGMPELFQAASGYCASVKDASGIIMCKMEFDAKKYSQTLTAGFQTGNSIVSIHNLYFRYHGAKKDTLENISMDIKKGDFLTVIGENGSGKTTLMKIIAGINTGFEKGIVQYRSRDVKKESVLGLVGYVYQNPDNQIFADTVFDEIAFALRTAKLEEKVVKKKTEEIAEIFGLSSSLNDDPFSLPKGDREKIACASVLVLGPELIILDEPTTGLDYPSYTALMKIMNDLNSKGKTIIMITHSMQAAAEYGRTIAAMAAGRLEYYGDKRGLFKDDTVLSRVMAKRTPLMELSLELNRALLLNYNEFSACWRKK